MGNSADKQVYNEGQTVWVSRLKSTGRWAVWQCVYLRPNGEASHGANDEWRPLHLVRYDNLHPTGLCNYVVRDCNLFTNQQDAANRVAANNQEWERKRAAYAQAYGGQSG